MTPARRAVAAAILFLLTAILAGVVPAERATIYRTFGLVEGLLAFLLVYILLEQRVWNRPPGALGWLAVSYGALATAQIFALLLPAPGVLQWVSVVAVLLLAWSALAIGSRRRLIGVLAGLAVMLALLKHSVIPLVWEHSGPGPGEAFGVGSALESVRRLVVDYEPIPRSSQLLGVLAVALWIAATRLLWMPLSEEAEWLASVPETIRGRLDG